MRKILVAFDGSDGSRKALRVGMDLARSRDAELWAVTVADQTPRYAGTVGEVQENQDIEGLDRIALEEARVLAQQSGADIKTELLKGHPAQSIVGFARDGGFDLIIVGHSGHSAVWGHFLGTTAEKISHHATCSVMVVR